VVKPAKILDMIAFANGFYLAVKPFPLNIIYAFIVTQALLLLQLLHFLRKKGYSLYDFVLDKTVYEEYLETIRGNIIVNTALAFLGHTIGVLLRQKYGF